MTRALTTFLLWLLMAALPLQSMAAAMQASCAGIAHHGLAIAATPAHHHDAAGAGHHDAVDEAGADYHKPAAYKKASCSACAACCTAAIALPSVFNPLPSRRDAVPASVFPTLHIASHIPPGLERPPRRMTA